VGRHVLPHTRKPERRIGLSALPLVRLSGRSSACVFGIYVERFVGDGLLVTLCHHGQAFLAAVPGAAVYHLRVDGQVALVAEHDLSGPVYDLVTAVLAIGEAPH
jgi:hypothetical protein